MKLSRMIHISVLITCILGLILHPILVKISMSTTVPMDYNIHYLTVIILSAFISAILAIYLSLKTYSLYKITMGELKKRAYYLTNFFTFLSLLSINVVLGWGYFLISGSAISSIDLGILKIYPFVLAMQYYFILASGESLFLFFFTMQFFEKPKQTLTFVVVLIFYTINILCLLPYNYFGFKSPTYGLYTKPVVAFLLFIITLTAIILGIVVTRKKIRTIKTDIKMKMRYIQLQLAYIFHLMLMLFYFIYSVLFELNLYNLAYISIGLAALFAVLSNILYYGCLVESRITIKIAELFTRHL